MHGTSLRGPVSLGDSTRSDLQRPEAIRYDQTSTETLLGMLSLYDTVLQLTRMRREDIDAKARLLAEPLPGPFTTKKGLEIALSYEEDVEPENRGWVVHRLNALLDQQFVGYLKAAYIPQENLARFYPEPYEVVAFASQVKGIGYRVLERFQAGEWQAVAESLNGHVHIPSFPDYFKTNYYKSVSAEQWEAAAREGLQAVEGRFRDEYKKFVRFHVNRPMVAYIHVEEEMRGSGIATLLYQEMAILLHTRYGLRLYASGLQQDAAKAAWDKMAETLPVRTERSPYKDRDGKTVLRRYLDGKDLIALRAEGKATVREPWEMTREEYLEGYGTRWTHAQGNPEHVEYIRRNGLRFTDTLRKHIDEKHPLFGTQDSIPLTAWVLPADRPNPYGNDRSENSVDVRLRPGGKVLRMGTPEWREIVKGISGTRGNGPAAQMRARYMGPEIVRRAAQAGYDGVDFGDATMGAVAINPNAFEARDHRYIIADALSKGLPVPAEVLAGYPELTASESNQPSVVQKARTRRA